MTFLEDEVIETSGSLTSRKVRKRVFLPALICKINEISIYKQKTFRFNISL